MANCPTVNSTEVAAAPKRASFQAITMLGMNLNIAGNTAVVITKESR